jgi:hypothetical protein
MLFNTMDEIQERWMKDYSVRGLHVCRIEQWRHFTKEIVSEECDRLRTGGSLFSLMRIGFLWRELLGCHLHLIESSLIFYTESL